MRHLTAPSQTNHEPFRCTLHFQPEAGPAAMNLFAVHSLCHWDQPRDPAHMNLFAVPLPCSEFGCQTHMRNESERRREPLARLRAPAPMNLFAVHPSQRLASFRTNARDDFGVEGPATKVVVVANTQTRTVNLFAVHPS